MKTNNQKSTIPFVLIGTPEHYTKLGNEITESLKGKGINHIVQFQNVLDSEINPDGKMGWFTVIAA